MATVKPTEETFSRMRKRRQKCAFVLDESGDDSGGDQGEHNEIEYINDFSDCLLSVECVRLCAFRDEQ